MQILPKDFLSIEDVAKYLEEIGYSYDLQIEYEYQRLLSNIYDLINERKVSAVFHCFGRFREEIEIIEYDEDSVTGEPIRIPIYLNTRNINIDDYFYIEKPLLREIFINGKEIKVEEYLRKYDENSVLSEGQEISYYLHNSFQITLRDIRIPRRELDIFFEAVSVNTTNNQIGKPSQKIPSDNNSNYVDGVGKPTITKDDPKTDKQIIDDFRKQIAQLLLEKENLESQLKQQINKFTDDEPTHHKSVGSIQALITTLIKMAEYDKADLADPFGGLNQTIQDKAERLGLSVKKDFIAKWLKKADEVL